jgi:alkylated DNA nucleotide flippase Atl1
VRAHEVTFLDLVQGEKQFQVPLYQRPYSWTEKELDKLWRDIREHAEGGRDGSSEGRHFLGSIVIAPSPALQAAGVQRWLVVDGQQRLTSLMIALTAIRDHLHDTGAPQAQDRIHRQYLVNEFRQGDDHLRLLPTQADREAYRGIVLHKSEPAAGSAVDDAYRFFRSALVTADDPDDPDDIDHIEQTIRSGLSIVEITAERGDNVFRIFESLNNSGLQLSQADLLRNYLFMRLPRRGEDVYRDVWLPMQKRLSTADLELLVWLDLLLRGDVKVKQSDVYRAQQERLDAVEDEAEIEAEVAGFARRARHLQRILDPAHEPDPRLREAFERLQEWVATAAYPLVMHLLDLEERGLADSDQLVEAMGYIEAFLVRRMICQIPTNSIYRIFLSAPQAVGEPADVPAAVRTYLSGRRRYWPTDATVRESVRSKPFYWIGRPQQRAFVLRRLEQSYGSPEPVDFRRAKVSVEHVLPQTPTDEWLELLRPDVVDEDGPEEVHERLVHTLGNLTLTAENARLSNSPFQRKQDIYQASSLQMNREIAEASSWGKEQILQRADRLADRIVRVWPGPVDGADDDEVEGQGWALLKRACAALPSGVWTTYGDLAELIGSHPVPVGSYLANQPVPNAYRVLTSAGTISSGFRWPDPERSDDPLELLAADGIPIHDGHADPAHRVTALELAELIGMDAGRLPAPEDCDEGLTSEAGEAFLAQVSAELPSAKVGARAVLDAWEGAGGRVLFPRTGQGSCYLAIETGDRSVPMAWPLAMHLASQTMEVLFHHIRRVPVFQDFTMREQLRQLLAEADAAIPQAKLGLRPNVPLALLSTRRAADAVSEALLWVAEMSKDADPT